MDFRRRTERPGVELTMIIVIMGMVVTISMALVQLVISQNALSDREIRQQQVFQIAEAGINYYRWHLAHYPNDYKDGTNNAGPYIHDFQDSTGKTIGRYELTITPPPTGSTISTIRSSGYLLTQPNARRSITVKLGIPSLSKYAVVAHDNMRFGVGTETFGPVHANGGIHFDGIAHGLVSSSQTTYTDPDGYGTKPGVWSLNSDASTFLGGKQFPVAPIDFNGITVDLAALKTLASSPSGLLLPSSGTQGYHLTFRTDDKVDIRKVVTQLRCQFRSGTGTCSIGTCSRRACSNNVTKSCSNNGQCPGGVCQTNTCTSGAQCPSSGSCNFENDCSYDSDCPSGGTCANLRNYGYCSNNYNRTCTVDSTCGTGNTCILSSFSIGTRASDQVDYQLGVPLPANGVIFAPEDVWVDGAIDSARVTVVAAADPLTTGLANVYLNNDLTYTHDDGQDAIGLIAQNSVYVGFFSKNDITIDAALIAQKGRVGRPYYGASFIGSSSSSNFQLSPVGSPLPNGGGGETSCRDFRKRDSLTSFGSLATFQRYGFAWTGSNTFNCGGGQYNDSGYCDRNLTFDSNLTFAPPPSFPTSGQYSIISYVEE